MNFDDAKRELEDLKEKANEMKKIEQRINELGELIGYVKSTVKVTSAPKKQYVQGFDVMMTAYIDQINQLSERLDFLKKETAKVYNGIMAMPTVAYQKLLLDKYYIGTPLYKQKYIGCPAYSHRKAIEEFGNYYSSV